MTSAERGCSSRRWRRSPSAATRCSAAPARAPARSSAPQVRSPTARCALGAGDDGAEQRAALLAMPGIGPWTADYVRMRVTGDPDVFLPGDVAVRAGAAAAGIPQIPPRSPPGPPARRPGGRT